MGSFAAFGSALAASSLAFSGCLISSLISSCLAIACSILSRASFRAASASVGMRRRTRVPAAARRSCHCNSLAVRNCLARIGPDAEAAQLQSGDRQVFVQPIPASSFSMALTRTLLFGLELRGQLLDLLDEDGDIAFDVVLVVALPFHFSAVVLAALVMRQLGVGADRTCRTRIKSRIDCPDGKCISSWCLACLSSRSAAWSSDLMASKRATILMQERQNLRGGFCAPLDSASSVARRSPCRRFRTGG